MVICFAEWLAVRESNKIGFVGQILPITAVLSLIILIYDRRKEPCSRKNLLRQNCLAPHGELIFDGFWWDFAKQGINLASKSTPKYAKSNRREAIRFDSRTASGQWTERGEKEQKFDQTFQSLRILKAEP